MCQVRDCQNSSQSHTLQKQCFLLGVVDSVRDYNQPLWVLFLGVGARLDDTGLFPQLPATLYMLIRLKARLGVLALRTHPAISQAAKGIETPKGNPRGHPRGPPGHPRGDPGPSKGTFWTPKATPKGTPGQPRV
ncbi:hypothetical protein WJX79_011137 [Trebouxia sp. C0005]